MVTQNPQQQQSRSAAKRISIVMFILLSIGCSYSQDTAAIVGTWVVRFGNGIERVYKIAADGSFSFADAGEAKEGKILTEDGQFVLRLADGRVQRFTKLSETLLKVEAFGSGDSFNRGRAHTVGSGRLETAAPTQPPAIATIPQAPTPTPKSVVDMPAASPLPTVPGSKLPNAAPVVKADDTPTPTSSRTLVLSPGWKTPLQGGTNTIDDLGKLFGSLTTAKTDLTGDDQIQVFQGISYLSPLAEAVASLKITTRLPAKVLIACPGFPKDSFYYYAFDGRFEDGFNRLYIVVDRADQVVSVQLVNESPKSEYSANTRDVGWHAYNFVNARTKALNTLRIEHKVGLWARNRWHAYIGSSRYMPDITQWNQDWTLLRLNSQLLKGEDGRFSKAKCLEDVRWYVPRPIVELILTCVQNPGR